MRFVISILAAVLFFTACGPAPRRIEPGNLFWPMPPSPPKIRYLESIYSEDDIGRVYTLKEKLFGKDYLDSLARPYGVFARRGSIIVTDISLRRVLIFDLAAKKLRFIGEEGSVQLPSAAVDNRQGNVYVADAAQPRIAVYDASGKYRTAFLLNDAKPVALAVNDSLGRLYVVDRHGHKVVVLNLDGKSLFEFGGQGEENGRFNIPLSIALDRAGKAYVLDSGNFRVQIFDQDGKFIGKFGSVGDRPGFFANPKGIAVDSEGHIYVTDAAFSNFQIFDQQGNTLLYIGMLGAQPGQLHLPAGISIDENDRICVADQFNRRIEIFQYLKDQ